MENLTTTTVFKIKQLVDNGSNITLSLSEDVELETVSQQQMILEAVDRTVTDEEVKQQIKPLLEAILNPSLKLLSKHILKLSFKLLCPREDMK